MKKGHYLVATAVIAMAFASCKPMDKTYSALDGAPAAKTITYTVQATDYTNTSIFASGTPVNKQKGFLSVSDANTYIPTLLNFKYYDAANGSTAKITFTPLVANITQPDSVYADLKYTLTNSADYLLLPGNKFADFSVAQVLSWLPYKYPTPAANEQHLLTWIFYPTIPATSPLIYPGISLANTVSGTTTTTNATGSFAYINGAWVQAYYITAAQYAAIGHGQYNQFTSSDDANLVSYLNGILKTDPSVSAGAKVGSVQYVSFNYYNTAKVTSQRILALTFDGTNWTHTSGAASLSFLKSSGTWIPDPTVYYTTISKDFALIGNTPSASLAGATTTAISNYAQYGTFTTTTSSTSFWSAAQIDAALIVILKADFPAPKTGIPYHINYQTYTGATLTTSETFKFDGTNWIKQ